MSVFLAFFLRFNLDLDVVLNFEPFQGILLCMMAALLSTTVTKSYAGIVRYTGIQDGWRIIRTELLSLGDHYHDQSAVLLQLSAERNTLFGNIHFVLHIVIAAVSIPAAGKEPVRVL